MNLFGVDSKPSENIDRINSVADFICRSEGCKELKIGYVVQREVDYYRLCLFLRGTGRDVISGVYENVSGLDLSSCWKLASSK
jgi:hypothetical protein